MVATEPEPIVIVEPGVSVWPPTTYCVAEVSAVETACAELPEPAVDVEATTTRLAVIPSKIVTDEDLVTIAVAVGDVDGNAAAGLPDTRSVPELLPGRAVVVPPEPEPTEIVEPCAEDCSATTTVEPEDWTLLATGAVANPERDVTAGDAAEATATVVGALLELAPLCCRLDAVEP